MSPLPPTPEATSSRASTGVTVAELDPVSLHVRERASGRPRLRALRRATTGVWFVLPALALFGLFVAYPLIETVRLSFFDWDGINEKLWIGLENYTELFEQDPVFTGALKHTLYWAVVTIPLQMGIGLALALVLDRSVRFRGFFRSVYFLPAVMSSVVIVFAWTWIYNPEVGLLNTVLGWFGGEGQAWLSEPDHALWASMVLSVWRYAGFSMIFYLAALQGIPTQLYEAARVDGASWWYQTRRVTIPMLAPMTWLLILLGIIGALREFEVIWILTRGGPADATNLLSVLVFKEAFEASRPGYAAAIATVLLVATAIASALVLIGLRRAQRRVAG
jgi:ABC-type sugar transport system permease subunit